MPYTEKRTSVTEISAEIRSEMQFEMENNNNQAELRLRGGSVYNTKETTEMQLGDVTLHAESAVSVQDTLHKTQNDLEVRALVFYRFRVYPGHPVAKGAAIGGAAGAGTGAVTGLGAGAGIGSAVSLLGGPIGLAIGVAVGSVVGIISGAVVGASGGGAVGAGFGKRRRHQQQFTITAKDVFSIMPGFREDGQFVFCIVRGRHAWRETRYTVQ